MREKAENQIDEKLCREVEKHEKSEKRKGDPELIVEGEKKYGWQVAYNRHGYVHRIAGGSNALCVNHFSKVCPFIVFCILKARYRPFHPNRQDAYP